MFLYLFSINLKAIFNSLLNKYFWFLSINNKSNIQEFQEDLKIKKKFSIWVSNWINGIHNIFINWIIWYKKHSKFHHTIILFIFSSFLRCIFLKLNLLFLYFLLVKIFLLILSSLSLFLIPKLVKKSLFL